MKQFEGSYYVEWHGWHLWYTPDNPLRITVERAGITIWRVSLFWPVAFEDWLIDVGF